MRGFPRFPRVGLALTFLVLGVMGSAYLLSTQVQGTAALRLFEDSPLPARPPGAPTVGRQTPEVVRYRWVRIRTEVLDQAVETGGFTLNLFPDAEYVVEGLRMVSIGRGRAWAGRLREFRWGDVIFSEVDGVYWGRVYTERGHYAIRPVSVGLGIYGVYEIDPEAIPLSRDDAMPPDRGRKRETSSRAMPAPALPEAPVEQDVMVVYTPAAKNQVGGLSAMESAIVNLVATANQAYQNSQIPLKLRLIGSREVAYAESGSCVTDLRRLTNPNDGYMDEVHVWRQNEGADLVTLVVALCSDFGGYAWLSCLRGSCDSDYGFNVVAYLDGMLFTHEVGHNQGCHHDWYVADMPGMYDYSHGHVDIAGRFLTIMSYYDKCNASRVKCSKILYFSNPSLLHGGRPLGVPPGTNTSCRAGNLSNPDCDADNARTITQTAREVAQYYERSSWSVRCEPWDLPFLLRISRCKVTSVRGFAGTVQLGCAKLPVGVSCKFRPDSVMLSADDSVESTLTVQVDRRPAAGAYVFFVTATSGRATSMTPMRLNVPGP
jgi:hypothetical protein